MRLNHLIYFCLFLFFFSCAEEKKSEQVEHPSIFRQISGDELGMDFSNDLKSGLELNIVEYLYYYNGGGVAVGDFDGDGLEDVYLGSNEGQDKIFRNLGGLRFEDVSDSSGLPIDSSWTSGVSVIDIDQDNDLDIYVTKVAPISSGDSHNLLFINNGDFTFTEKSDEYGLDFSGYGTQALFLDYDKDGDNDIYLINHSVHSVRSFGSIKQRTDPDPLSGDRLFENQLNESLGKFIDVTTSSKIYSSALGYGLSGAVHDFNDDGWPDIYICNDFHENDYLYINMRDGSFKESSSEWFSHTSKFSMGVDIADIDGDSEMDVFTTDMLPWQKSVAMKSGGEDTEKVFNIRLGLGYEPQYARNQMHIKNGEHFLELGLYTNTYATDWSWAPLCQDFDHNGYTDIFITNGIVQRPNDLDYMKFLNQQGALLEDSISIEELNQVLDIMPSEATSNILFTQTEKLKFSDVNNSQVSSPTFSTGAAYSDLDNDGDLDLITSNINSQVSVYENQTLDNNHVSFKLQWDKSKLGAIINVKTDQKEYTRIYNPVRGYQSSSTHSVHFPFKSNEQIQKVLVRWPDGKEELYHNIEQNKLNVLTYGSGFNDEVPKSGKLLVADVKITELDVIHLDNEYADYDHDLLIPEKLSTEGPPVIIADFNNDGINDLYLGSGRFSSAQLLFGNKSGSYDKIDCIDFNRDSKYEDVSAAALDFDDDGDLDLYVSSGGNDIRELNELLQDRLYINQGDGTLKRLPTSLPYTNGGTVSTGDINGDGYPEIFIGARSIPNAYGLSPYSFLLSSKQGLGIDLLWKKRLGMLTDSEIIDFNNDGDQDLIVCGDWMPIMIGLNEGGQVNFINSYSQSVRSEKGLWNAITLEDINGDNILDIIGCNVGQNFKWKVSKDQVTKMYLLDVDQNGSNEPIIFTEYFGKKMPFHNLDRLIEQVPLFKKTYLRYADFSQINSADDLIKTEVMETKELTELRSAVFISQDSVYQFNALPDVFQMTSIKDLQVIGKKILYIGNEDRFITELGSMNGTSAALCEYSYSDSLQFNKHRYLDIDNKLNTRRLELIEDNKLILTNYKSQPLILELN